MTARNTREKSRKAMGRGKPLSLTDLEIPVRPLLTREEEYHCGSRVREALGRLAEFLPRHPTGSVSYTHLPLPTSDLV